MRRAGTATRLSMGIPARTGADARGLGNQFAQGATKDENGLRADPSAGTGSLATRTGARPDEEKRRRRQLITDWDSTQKPRPNNGRSER
jgi:hypothetical protein